MNKITFPLKPRMKGSKVEDLHAALQVFLDRALLLRDDEEAPQKLFPGLETDRAKNTYGSTTRELVSIYQEEQGLEVSGSVDEPTANAMNRLLDELGKFDESGE